MSPVPGRSTLITSAPIKARSWVQVGPDCTWVKSRILTPSSARPARPKGRFVGFGRPPPAAGFAAAFGAGFLALNVTTLAADFFAAGFAFAAFVFAALDFALAACLRFAICHFLSNSLILHSSS